VKDSTTNYTYPMAVTNKDATNETVRIDGRSEKAALKSYVGQVKLNPVASTSEVSTLATLCEAKAPGKAVVGGAIDAAGNTPAARCGTAAIELGLK
jgi:type IV pilus assembly protein PilA